MERRRATLVAGCEAQPKLLEVVKTDGLVSLRGDVHAVQPVGILYLHVCAELEKLLNNVDVSAEACVMDGTKFVRCGFHVNPVF